MVLQKYVELRPMLSVSLLESLPPFVAIGNTNYAGWIRAAIDRASEAEVTKKSSRLRDIYEAITTIARDIANINFGTHILLNHVANSFREAADYALHARAHFKNPQMHHQVTLFFSLHLSALTTIAEKAATAKNPFADHAAKSVAALGAMAAQHGLTTEAQDAIKGLESISRALKTLGSRFERTAVTALASIQVIIEFAKDAGASSVVRTGEDAITSGKTILGAEEIAEMDSIVERYKCRDPRDWHFFADPLESLLAKSQQRSRGNRRP